MTDNSKHANKYYKYAKSRRNQASKKHNTRGNEQNNKYKYEEEMECKAIWLKMRQQKTCEC